MSLTRHFRSMALSALSPLPNHSPLLWRVSASAPTFCERLPSIWLKRKRSRPFPISSTAPIGLFSASPSPCSRKSSCRCRKPSRHSSALSSSPSPIFHRYASGEQDRLACIFFSVKVRIFCERHLLDTECLVIKVMHLLGE